MAGPASLNFVDIRYWNTGCKVPQFIAHFGCLRADGEANALHRQYALSSQISEQQIWERVQMKTVENMVSRNYNGMVWKNRKELPGETIFLSPIVHISR